MNNIFLSGAMGQDPEIKYLENGKLKVTASIAVNEYYKDQERTDWFNLEFWNKQAERLAENAKKGDTLVVNGKLRNSSYTDENGLKKIRTYVSADWFKIIPRKEKES